MDVSDLDGCRSDVEEEDCCDSDDKDMLEDFMDSNIWSITDIDSYRSDVDEEDNCDSDVADLEGLNYLGRNCIMDVSASGSLSLSESDLTGPNGPYITDGPVGQIGTLSPSISSSEILVDPGGTLPSSDLAGMLLPAMPVGPIGRWGTLPPSDSDLTGPDDPYATDSPVGQIGTLSQSTSSLEILMDPGGTLPSFDLAGMLCCSRLYLLALLAGGGYFPRPTLTLLARLLLVAPSANLGLPPSTFASAILVDPGGTFPSSDLAGMLLPAIPVRPVGALSSSDSDPAGRDGSHVTDGPVGHLGTLPLTTSESGILVGFSPRPTLLG